MRKLALTLIMLAMALAAAGCFGNGAENGGTDGNADASLNEAIGNETGSNGNESGGSPDNAASVAEGGDRTEQGGEPQAPGGAETPQAAADAVIAALERKDLETLKSYIHPAKGILFAPYVHIDTETALVFRAAELPGMDDGTVYTWGSYDGSGEPIELTFAQYYDRFVYDKDFANAEEIGMDEVKGSGNTLPNIKEVFPASYIVDYYFSGFEPEFEGMDWASLILVLEEHDGAWYIGAAVHNQWTI